MPSTFAPATDVPVPAEYVVGPGDTIEVQLIGNTKGRYALVVGRDGRINFPELGPIAVSGRRFEEVRADIEARVREQMIGTQASVGIGELRSIRVFVLGDAQVPGSYTVSGLSTITNALFVSGGVKKIGSLRNIQLKRAGRTVTTLDLYDLLLRGDTSADARLLPGDVIFVPPVGTDSRSRRRSAPAGDLRAQERNDRRAAAAARRRADAGSGSDGRDDRARRCTARARDRRRRPRRARPGSAQLLRSGDTVRVPAIRPVLEDSVVVSGFVHRPGEYQFRPGMRIADVLPSLDELKPNADQRYVLVRRELPPDRRVRIFSANLERALAEPDSAAEFRSWRRATRSYVFDLESGRDRIIEPLMRELRMQSRIDEPTHGSQRRRPHQGARQVSARAGHARQRPAARRRQSRRGRVRRAGRADALRGRRRRGAPGRADQDRPARGARRRSGCGPAAAAVRLPGDQGSAAVGFAGRSRDPRRGALPGTLSDSSRRDAALGAWSAPAA